jgi:hypothetical protein
MENRVRLHQVEALQLLHLAEVEERTRVFTTLLKVLDLRQGGPEVADLHMRQQRVTVPPELAAQEVRVEMRGPMEVWQTLRLPVVVVVQVVQVRTLYLGQQVRVVSEFNQQ